MSPKEYLYETVHNLNRQKGVRYKDIIKTMKHIIAELEEVQE